MSVFSPGVSQSRWKCVGTTVHPPLLLAVACDMLYMPN